MNTEVMKRISWNITAEKKNTAMIPYRQNFCVITPGTSKNSSGWEATIGMRCCKDAQTPFWLLRVVFINLFLLNWFIYLFLHLFILIFSTKVSKHRQTIYYTRGSTFTQTIFLWHRLSHLFPALLSAPLDKDRCEGSVRQWHVKPLGGLACAGLDRTWRRSRDHLVFALTTQPSPLLRQGNHSPASSQV